LVVDDGSFAVMFTALIDSLRAFKFSRSAPLGDFLVVVLHSYPFPIAYELLFIIIGFVGGTLYSTPASSILAEGDEITQPLEFITLTWLFLD
jgi:hypothetical protein